MADVANKYPENAAGKFYVDEQCIDCDLCRETAPAKDGTEAVPPVLQPDITRNGRRFSV